jgi:hypothetical protein
VYNYDVHGAQVHHQLALYPRDGTVYALTWHTQRLSESYVGSPYNCGAVPLCCVLTVVWLSIHLDPEAELEALCGARFWMANAL